MSPGCLAPRDPPVVTAGATRGEALARLTAIFAKSGIETASLDARLLVGAALGIEPSTLVAGRDLPLNDREARRLDSFAVRRLAREPVARILGLREFWGLPFRLSAGTLEPRPDSETVIEAALACVQDRGEPLAILDLGTGSGCLLVALLTELPAAWGLGLDRSPDALLTARGNAALNGVGARACFAGSDWGRAVNGRFDLVVANPPYIPRAEIEALAPEVALHDPVAALDGGSDGLDAYRRILDELPGLMAPGGTAVLEIGWDQGLPLACLAEERGLALRRVARDLGGRDRAVVLGALA